MSLIDFDRPKCKCGQPLTPNGYCLLCMARQNGLLPAASPPRPVLVASPKIAVPQKRGPKPAVRVTPPVETPEFSPDVREKISVGKAMYQCRRAGGFAIVYPGIRLRVKDQDHASLQLGEMAVVHPGKDDGKMQPVIRAFPVLETDIVVCRVPFVDGRWDVIGK